MFLLVIYINFEYLLQLNRENFQIWLEKATKGGIICETERESSSMLVMFLLIFTILKVKCVFKSWHHVISSHSYLILSVLKMVFWILHIKSNFYLFVSLIILISLFLSSYWLQSNNDFVTKHQTLSNKKKTQNI